MNAPLRDSQVLQQIDNVGLLMRLALNSIRADVDRRLMPHRLTHAQWVPLLKISRGEPVNVMALARAMSIDAGALTRSLSRLEDKGLLVRVRSEEDRRCVRLEATAAGRALADEVQGVLTDVLSRHLAGFSPQEVTQLISLLQRLIANGDSSCPGPDDPLQGTTE